MNDELGMSRKNLEWYIDTRLYGTVPSTRLPVIHSPRWLSSE